MQMGHLSNPMPSPNEWPFPLPGWSHNPPKNYIALDSPWINCMCSNPPPIKKYKQIRFSRKAACFIKDLQRRPLPKRALTLRFSEKASSLPSIPGTCSQTQILPIRDSASSFQLSVQWHLNTLRGRKSVSLFWPGMQWYLTTRKDCALSSPSWHWHADTQREEADPRTTP